MKTKPVLDVSYWEFVQQITNEVDAWPEWLRGGKSTKNERAGTKRDKPTKRISSNVAMTPRRKKRLA